MINKLIGIPFTPLGRDYKGADCAGLVILFYRDILKISHENYLIYTDVLDNNESKIFYALNNAKFKRCESPKLPGDLLVIRTYGLPAHLGICVDDRYFLHTLDKVGSHLAEYDNPSWNRRIESRWRMI